MFEHHNVILIYVFKKLQNICRYTVVILVQTSRKKLNFARHHCVNLMYFFQNYKYRSICLWDFGTNKSKLLDFGALL